MGKKRTPQTPREYAEYLYCLHDFHPAGDDAETIKVRVRAFIDGVKWERRRRQKLEREAHQRASRVIRATHSG